MPHSFRSRLWWSYVLVTMAALGIVAFVLFIYIIQNPSTYRQASARLTVVAALLRKNEAILDSLTPTEPPGAHRAGWSKLRCSDRHLQQKAPGGG